jgi:hypothetical protein
LNDFKNDFKGLKISLDVAKNMDDVHTKNIEDIQGSKFEGMTRIKREKKNVGYLKQHVKRPNTTQKSMKTKSSGVKLIAEKRDVSPIDPSRITAQNFGVKWNTMNNFYPSEIFSKTSLDNIHTEDHRFGYNNRIKQSESRKTNFIEKNKKLGRVADINKRRFSGAFDHLNAFPKEDAEKERNLRIKTMKRSAITARTGNRKDISEFKKAKERSQTPIIHSYQNCSVNERKGIMIKNPNNLISKINPNEVYEKIMSANKPTTAQTVRAPFESFSKFNPYNQTSETAADPLMTRRTERKL